MRSTNALAGLLAALVAASAFAAPQAVAAACQYTIQDLPLPPVLPMRAETTGSSTNNSRIVGVRTDSMNKLGLLWVNSTLREMPQVPLVDVIPAAVNNVSVVAGSQESRPDGGSVVSRAFRYEAGVYTILQTEPGEQSSALGINDAGDVVGLVRTSSTEAVAVWPRTGTRKLFGAGYPRGIDAQRRVAVSAPGPGQSGWVLDTDTGTRTELPGSRAPMVFDNGRVLAFEGGPLNDPDLPYGIGEWDLTGVKVAKHLGGLAPYGRNGSGTVFGRYTTSAPSLWRPSGRTDVVAEHLPQHGYYSDITDAATLIGTYENADRQMRPARWLWVCS
ncbi:hypothetical protein [Lentzea sp. NBRC 102530]|uniref:hypothetical protein n=1 Tax=Lentzea sp. NBRC 102530 TaxID=3032201 RepID=UPI0024A02082|nr:hypothetical protein [Lentzea sp. NBRC 102530]GLY47504.1 hypothetical protein Lesp01_11600 [Lentzea sp. NBRC 102530]